MLIQITGDEDLHVFPANLVKPPPSPEAIGQHITAVEPDATGFAAQHNDFVDCFANVIGVHEQSRLLRKNVEEITESFGFVIVRHDPRVRLCSINGDAEGMTCEGVGCSCAAGNAGCASGENCSFYAVSPAGAKFDDRPAGGGCGYSRCFAGDEGLEVQDRQEAGLDELGFCNWSCNSEQRFARKEDRTFWQRPNIAREVEPPEKVIEARLNVSKYWQIAEEGDFLGGEVNVFKGI